MCGRNLAGFCTVRINNVLDEHENRRRFPDADRQCDHRSHHFVAVN
jgi:hypothetical protein